MLLSRQVEIFFKNIPLCIKCCLFTAQISHGPQFSKITEYMPSIKNMTAKHMPNLKHVLNCLEEQEPHLGLGNVIASYIFVVTRTDGLNMM